jgi:hypothetical protein
MKFFHQTSQTFPILTIIYSKRHWRTVVVDEMYMVMILQLSVGYSYNESNSKDNSDIFSWIKS